MSRSLKTNHRLYRRFVGGLVAVLVLGGGTVESDARAEPVEVTPGEQYRCTEVNRAYSPDRWQHGAFQLCGRAEFGRVDWTLPVRELQYSWGSHRYLTSTEAHVRATVSLSKDCKEIDSERQYH
jgi:hypothetical protein